RASEWRSRCGFRPVLAAFSQRGDRAPHPDAPGVSARAAEPRSYWAGSPRAVDRSDEGEIRALRSRRSNAERWVRPAGVHRAGVGGDAPTDVAMAARAGPARAHLRERGELRQ